MSAAPTVSEVERFRGLVQQWLGLDFDESKQGTLSEVLRKRLDENGRSAAAYLHALEAPDRARGELRILAQDLTVNETSFFRNADQIRAFSEVALPDRLSARSVQRQLRILSAGCASGEEAYTLAACVRDMPGIDKWDVRIHGIDISPAMLKKAAAGRYSSWSLRQTPDAVRSRLFRAEGREFVLDKAVRSMVTFEERNLIAEDAAFWAPGSFDIVFCRNVIMYFAPETAQAVIARIARSLTPGGFLFLGHAETLRGLSTDFHLRHTHGTFYYQRKDASEPTRSAGPAEQAYPSLDASLDAFVHSDSAWVDTIRQASQRIQLLAAAPKAAGKRPVERGASGAASRSPDLTRALDLLGREKFVEAQAVLDALPPERACDADVLLLNAVLLTHGGDLTAAEEVCEELLRLDELNAGAHYVMALCRESAGDDRGAARHDQIAAYLDPSFAMPRLHQGLLCRRGGDRDTARLELRQALLLLQREDPSHLLLFGGGFSRTALMALCRAELAACGGAP